MFKDVQGMVEKFTTGEIDQQSVGEAAQQQVNSMPHEEVAQHVQTAADNAQQNGQPVLLAQGQTLEVTLQNPGDGLYSFDQPKYDAVVLRFVDHLHQAPINNNIGNDGTDSWDFTAIKAGSTTLTITATRGSDASTATVLSNSVSVK